MIAGFENVDIQQNQYEKSGKVITYTSATVKILISFVDAETGEKITASWVGHGVDYGPGEKAQSKAITYGIKTYIIARFLVSDKEKMTLEEFLKKLEMNGLSKNQVKCGLLLLGYKTSSIDKSRLDAIYTEILAIQPTIEKFHIDLERANYFETLVKPFSEICKPYQIARYMMSQGQYNYPSQSGQIPIQEENLVKFLENGASRHAKNTVI